MSTEAVIVIIVIVILIPGFWLIAVYNRLMKLKQYVKDSWAGIDVELKRRYDLIPNLVEVVKSYASHEKEVLTRVVELRTAAVASTGTAATQASDEQKLQMGMKRLFAVAEGYPQLKADANFRELQSQLAVTEDRIAAARRFFNGNVRDMNQLTKSFPTNLVAGAFAIRTETYFEITDEAERVVPRVAV